MTRFMLLFGGIGVLLGLYQFRRWSLRVGPVRTARVLRWAGVTTVSVLLLVLLARSGSALVLLPLLVPVLLSWRSLWQPVPTTSGSTASGSGESGSTVETRFLRMSLDHATGAMSGTVLTGVFQGFTLDQLSLQQLVQLWRECQSDAQSVAVLEAYLDRIHGDVWREECDKRGYSSDGNNDVQEACNILGLKPGATPEEIKVAHRRLMQRMHPDHGGSAYLAARINWARDFLLSGVTRG